MKDEARLLFRRGTPSSKCAYGTDIHANGSVDYVDVDFEEDGIIFHQANVLSHQCTQKIHMSWDMFFELSERWKEYRTWKAKKEVEENKEIS